MAERLRPVFQKACVLARLKSKMFTIILNEIRKSHVIFQQLFVLLFLIGAHNMYFFETSKNLFNKIWYFFNTEKQEKLILAYLQITKQLEMKELRK